MWASLIAAAVCAALVAAGLAAQGGLLETALWAGLVLSTLASLAVDRAKGRHHRAVLGAAIGLSLVAIALWIGHRTQLAAALLAAREALRWVSFAFFDHRPRVVALT